MMRASRLFSFVAAALLACSAASVQAQDCGGLGYAALYGFGGVGGFGGYGMRSTVPTPPYFALHPPVYYGARYTRPYGTSPFAAFPQMQPNPNFTPKPAAPHTLSVVNPYAPQHAASAEPSGSIVAQPVAPAPVQPLVIENPYFKPEAARYVREESNQ
ncbi:MAG: hypothetical protein U0892_03760 [Pirellulales bacterium]